MRSCLRSLAIMSIGSWAGCTAELGSSEEDYS